jgi:hypothetical protein
MLVHEFGEQEVDLDDEVRMTIRLPGDAAAYLADEAKENFTSKNAQVVRAIRAAMNAKGPAEAPTSPSRDQNPNHAMNGGDDA